MQTGKVLLSIVVLIALIVALNLKFGSVPPLGKFFDPDSGFWANAETALPDSKELELPGLKDEVMIYYDERRVPHIFARNDFDLYYAQGYVVARDRLFQLEMQTYDAAGRLTEVVGESQLNRDKRTRRMGMVYGAERALEYVKEDEKSWEIFNAYADGVNAWINSLSPDEYPLEYKILDAEPEEWTPLKTVLLLKNMTRTLASGNSEDRSSNTMKYFGEDFLNRFFTQDPELLEPVIPPSREWDFEAGIPEAPDTLFVPASARELPTYERPEGVGSNNWAVHGSKTASGFPILANDPHLSLTLPSIWYEIQLNAPGINTYGVTLQGAPGVIIGFNEQIAWGVTNVASDVMDWYELELNEDKTEYRHDGEWKPVSMKVEEFKIKGGETVLDTVLYTHHGPVTESRSRVNEEREPAYHALRWIAHEPSNEIKTFYMLNRAQNYENYVEALSYYRAPAQNFVFASNEGDIALWVNGRFPKKWEHQGRTVNDGTDPVYDWQGWIPHEQNPHIKNPERGFVSSANQESVSPDYPYYLDDDFAPFERGKRINDRLREMDSITKDDMQALQMDNYSYHAATILPEMLSWITTDSLNEYEQEVLAELQNWNFYNEAELKAPGIFRQWWANMYNAVFSDEFGTTDAILRYPPRDRVTEVLKNEPEFEFIDDIETEKEESREDLALASFKETVEELTDFAGRMDESWDWGVLINNDIHHMAYIPGMGVMDLYSSGSSESMIEPWRTGQLFELNFLKKEPSDYNYRIRINPSK